MRAKLSLKNGRTDYLFTRQATIGSAPTCTIVLQAPDTAPIHAQIVFDEHAGSFFIEPGENVKNLLLEGKQIRQRAQLYDTQEISFGNSVSLIFQLQTDSEFSGRKRRGKVPKKGNSISGTLPSEAPTIVVGLDSASIQSLSRDEISSHQKTATEAPSDHKKKHDNSATHVITATQSLHETLFLQVTEGTSHQVFKLHEGENIVGRSQGSDIRLDDLSISRRHAAIVVSGMIVHIKDLGSKNHTFVNRERIVGEIQLPAESQLRFGVVEARVIRSMYSESAIRPH